MRPQSNHCCSVFMVSWLSGETDAQLIWRVRIMKIGIIGFRRYLNLSTGWELKYSVSDFFGIQ